MTFAKVRKMLAEKRIYIPLFWPNVLTDSDASSLEKELALLKNSLSLLKNPRPSWKILVPPRNS